MHPSDPIATGTLKQPEPPTEPLQRPHGERGWRSGLEVPPSGDSRPRAPRHEFSPAIPVFTKCCSSPAPRTNLLPSAASVAGARLKLPAVARLSCPRPPSQDLRVCHGASGRPAGPLQPARPFPRARRVPPEPSLRRRVLISQPPIPAMTPPGVKRSDSEPTPSLDRAPPRRKAGPGRGGRSTLHSSLSTRLRGIMTRREWSSVKLRHTGPSCGGLAGGLACSPRNQAGRDDIPSHCSQPGGTIPPPAVLVERTAAARLYT